MDTTTGQDIPGTYTCCTARYVSRPFRLKPNGITRKRVNVKVYNVRSNDINIRIHSSDGLALSFGPGGRLPLKINPSQLGSFNTGTPLLARLLAPDRPRRPPRGRLPAVGNRPDVPVGLQALAPALERKTGGPKAARS